MVVAFPIEVVHCPSALDQLLATLADSLADTALVVVGRSGRIAVVVVGLDGMASAWHRPKIAELAAHWRRVLGVVAMLRGPGIHRDTAMDADREEEHLSVIPAYILARTHLHIHPRSCLALGGPSTLGVIVRSLEEMADHSLHLEQSGNSARVDDEGPARLQTPAVQSGFSSTMGVPWNCLLDFQQSALAYEASMSGQVPHYQSQASRLQSPHLE